jgi:hypothetical protein
MNVPFDGIAYLIVFNMEGVASLHFPVDIDVLFCNQCYSGLSCRIFDTPARVLIDVIRMFALMPSPALGS